MTYTSKPSTMNWYIKTFYSIIAFALVASFFPSCVDKDFDEPPVEGVDPGLVANTTVAELKAMYDAAGQARMKFPADAILELVVTANDQSGNFFKEFYVEDGTGALKIVHEFRNAHNYYQVGRQLYLYVDSDSLLITKSDGLYEVGYAYSQDAGFVGIPRNLRDKFLSPGLFNQTVTPLSLTLEQALFSNDELMGRLVQFEGVQFSDGNLNTTYAEVDPIPSTVNKNITDCNDEIILRNSGFADFATDTVPGGKGTLTAILNRFGNTRQLFIRDTDDLQFNEPRCGAATGNEQLRDIADIRALYTGTATSAPSETKIVGTVISDRIEGNTTARNMIVQDGTAGIIVRLTDNHSFLLNDQVEIVISDQELSTFPAGTGALQINNVPLAAAVKIGTNNVTPAVKTISEILADIDGLESTLVQINNPSIDGSTFDFAQDVTDGTATMELFTAPAAAFSGAIVPDNITSMVAIVSSFNNPQLLIRGLYDIDGTTAPPSECELDEDFESGSFLDPISDLAGWTSQSLQGVDEWVFKDFDNNVFAEMRSFQAQSTDGNDAWMVTPAIDISTQQIMTFRVATAFWTHDALTVYYATNFTGDVEDATWVPLNPSIPTSPADSFGDFMPSGDVMLPLGTTCHIAFRYVGNSDDGETCTYRIDDIKICEQ